MDRKIKISLILFAFIFCCLRGTALAQFKEQLEVEIDTNAKTSALPKAFRPNMDLSGQGFNRDPSWPQTLAAREVLDKWQKDIGFKGFYRLQYNLWEISKLEKDTPSQNALLNNYEALIKSISDSGGVVILNLFGTPAGMGNVLDENSPPHNLKAYKQLVKAVMRNLSCDKKYNIWYEVWNAPDLDDFFLGKRQEYFNMYRAVAEAVKELRQETKANIRLGGPGTSCWFQNLEANTIFTPEKSLIYELIKYCYSYRLPLDFICWHAYSCDPLADKQDTVYNKPVVNLIRDWMEYFRFDRNTPLIIDEWNFDRDANQSPARGEKSYIAASYIPSRLKAMAQAGIDHQTYFSLEDFEVPKEELDRNLGVFSFNAEHTSYKGSAKASYNVFRMLGVLGENMLEAKLDDDFVGVIPTRTQDELVLLIYNYIDPEIGVNYISRNAIYLSSAQRKALLNIIKSDRLYKIFSGALSLDSVRMDEKVRGIFKIAMEMDALGKKLSSTNRRVKLSIKGYKGIYSYSRYVVAAPCSFDCVFKPAEEKEIDFNQPVTIDLDLAPYSVQMLIFKKKPIEAPADETKPAEAVKPVVETKPAAETKIAAADAKKNAEGK
ncbi:MAG: cellulase family glycosylhydrolase [Candidatus Omnitrophota bacterium]